MLGVFFTVQPLGKQYEFLFEGKCTVCIAHVHVNVIVADVNADFTGVPFD